MELVEWNQLLENKKSLTNLDEVLDLFLWRSEPFEKYHPEVQFNKNQLLGLLICRCLHNEPVKFDAMSRLQLIDTHPLSMNFKEMKDTLANIQFEWPQYINQIQNDEVKVQNIKNYVSLCMSRIGELVSQIHPNTVLNDIHDTCIDQAGFTKLTSSAIRRIIGSILIINRHIDLYDMSEELTPIDHSIGITAYHHEASMENFHKLCMHFYLPAAAKLHYKHDFPGMYNDVSQAVYFHNSEYKRIKREEYTSTTPIHMLPSVCLLYPEIPVKFEDDLFNPYEDQGWYWVLLPSRVYLVSPEPKVYYSTNLSTLIHMYITNK
jgi:hypothetical protein